MVKFWYIILSILPLISALRVNVKKNDGTTTLMVHQHLELDMDLYDEMLDEIPTMINEKIIDVISNKVFIMELREKCLERARNLFNTWESVMNMTFVMKQKFESLDSIVTPFNPKNEADDLLKGFKRMLHYYFEVPTEKLVPLPLLEGK